MEIRLLLLLFFFSLSLSLSLFCLSVPIRDFRSWSLVVRYKNTYRISHLVLNGVKSCVENSFQWNSPNQTLELATLLHILIFLMIYFLVSCPTAEPLQK